MEQAQLEDIKVFQQNYGNRTMALMAKLEHIFSAPDNLIELFIFKQLDIQVYSAHNI